MEKVAPLGIRPVPEKRIRAAYAAALAFSPYNRSGMRVCEYEDADDTAKAALVSVIAPLVDEIDEAGEKLRRETADRLAAEGAAVLMAGEVTRLQKEVDWLRFANAFHANVGDATDGIMSAVARTIARGMRAAGFGSPSTGRRS